MAYQYKNTYGPSIVYSQQRRFLDTKGIEKSPQLIFQEDILREIQRWMEEGDYIILAVDVNECVLQGEFANKLQNIGMKEAITSNYKKEQEIEATFEKGS